MLENINLFNGLNEKMAFLAQRQRVLSQNITNADTPGYRPSDVKSPDFGKILGEKSASTARLSLATTQSGHMDHIIRPGSSPNLMTERKTYEVSPTGNAVDLEEQMMKSSQTNMDYQLITNLYTKNLEAMRSAMRGSR